MLFRPASPNKPRSDASSSDLSPTEAPRHDFLPLNPYRTKTQRLACGASGRPAGGAVSCCNTSTRKPPCRATTGSRHVHIAFMPVVTTHQQDSASNRRCPPRAQYMFPPAAHMRPRMYHARSDASSSSRRILGESCRCNIRAACANPMLCRGPAGATSRNACQSAAETEATAIASLSDAMHAASHPHLRVARKF